MKEITCSWCKAPTSDDFYSVRHWKDGEVKGEFAICFECAMYE